MLTRLAPHLVKPVSFLYPLRHRVWERPYVTAGLTLYDSDGRGPLGARPPAAHPAPAHCAMAPALQQGRAGRRPALLRRAGRRRPAHDDARPHRGDVRRDRAQPRPGSSACSTRASGSSARRSDRRRVRRAGRRCRARWSSTAPGCGPTTSRTMAGGRGRSTCGPPRACTSSCPATGSTPRPGSSCARRRRCSSSSRGAPTGSSAPPTPTGSSTGPTRPRTGPTSTTSSSTSTPCSPRR